MLLLLLFAYPLHAEDDDLRTLELYNAGQVELLNQDRSPRPASQTAENITVVTAEEIRALNAHTLTDLLYTVVGIQIQNPRTPGSFVYLAIEGSNTNHILVLIDNVPINILTENLADVGSIPVQMIDRIEIVKGAASSSWGSALGGVINVITKSPQPDRAVAGAVSASYGSNETVDARAELSGTFNRFGYYLTGGKLLSDGLVPHNAVELNSIYGKITYDLPARGSLTFITGLTSNESGAFRVDLEIPTPDGPLAYSATEDMDIRQLISSLSLRYPLLDRFELYASLRARESEVNIDSRNSMSGTQHRSTDESSLGGSFMLSWVGNMQRISTGVDYDYVEADLDSAQLQGDQLNPEAHRVGVYLNDTITLGAFAITPSARFDHTGTGSNLFSPSLGVTYAVTDNSVLRAYGARGYSITSILRDDSTEKVWTAQLGFETADIPYLWLKGTIFHNDTWNIAVPILTPEGDLALAFQREVKQGYELEVKTTPVFDTSLSLAYTYLDAENETTDTVLEGVVARHTLKVGLKYENPAYLRALLFGNYTDWNGDGGPYDGNYSAMVWDLHLGKEFVVGPDTTIEVFSSLRNLFNGAQELFPYKYPRRWAEVGVRCSF